MVAINTNVEYSEPVKGVPVASLAYVLYEQNGGVCAATRHAVVKGRLQLGRVIDLDMLASDLASRERAATVELLPESVVVATPSMLAWTSPQRLADMWFRVTGRHTSYRVWWPRLLWLADRRGHGLRVFALASGRRPQMATRLYHAPLMNINHAGHLCEGTARLPATVNIAAMPEIEACVFESCFTHINHNATLRGGADNKQHVAYWRNKGRTRERVRVQEMTPYRRLGEVLNA
ncbi:MAG TPA: hypothetical protein PKZ76_17600 [Xanthomonadaceae bacterium]|nr:hypothetical protein [Xanthomonadaceae bacterium]